MLPVSVGHLIVLGVLLTLAVFYRTTLRLFGMVIIPDNCLGQVTKKFTLVGKNRTLAGGKIVALEGEAGIQADTLAPGLHWRFWPWQYSVKAVRFTVIPDDKIGLVEAIDGQPMPAGRVLARKVDCNSFQDARAFIMGKGQRGPQITVIPPGTYRINTDIFNVSLHPVTEIHDNMVGIVTTQEGQPLSTGDIAGKEIAGHSMFQDGDAFVMAGGYKGLQEQVILAGRYFLNPEFVSVEEKPMTPVPIASVGVVIAYVGAVGKDVSGDAFKHGNLVGKGEKGVWNDPLDPGMYPINPYTHKVENVPTANVVLNWATGKSEAHKLDANLSSITVRSSDGFKYNMDVSQIIHIPRGDAPKVIARFGSMVNLVTQVLEPTIGNYFRNSAQSSDAITFLAKRSERQGEARDAIAKALQEYNVGAVDTLIGDIATPEELMKPLTARKIAQQEEITFQTQEKAQEARKLMMQAQSMAETQPTVVKAEREVSIAEFNAKANIAKAEGEAKAKTIQAEADANVTTVTGNALATKTKAVGEAEAAVIRLKTEAVGQSNYALIEVGRALAEHNIRLVPEINVAGESNGGSSGMVSAFLGTLMHDAATKNGTPEKA